MAAITVKGMSCNHCKTSVEETLGKIPGLADIKVDLGSGKVEYTEASPVELEQIRQAIKKIGFEVV